MNVYSIYIIDLINKKNYDLTLLSDKIKYCEKKLVILSL